MRGRRGGVSKLTKIVIDKRLLVFSAVLVVSITLTIPITAQQSAKQSQPSQPPTPTPSQPSRTPQKQSTGETTRAEDNKTGAKPSSNAYGPSGVTTRPDDRGTPKNQEPSTYWWRDPNVAIAVFTFVLCIVSIFQFIAANKAANAATDAAKAAQDAVTEATKTRKGGE